MTAELVLRYDPDDPIERARIAAIVRDAGERLRGVLWTLRERLRRICHWRSDG